jgi:hypothetical protein
MSRSVDTEQFAYEDWRQSASKSAPVMLRRA